MTTPVARAASRFDNNLRYGDANHPRQWHLTPPYILDRVREDLDGQIMLDPCTFADNPVGASEFFTADDDGLASEWDAHTVFVNPPYGKAREPWVERSISAGYAGSKVVLLIPAATDTRIFQRAASSASATVLVRGRVKFGSLRDNGRQHAASHPSALLGWNTSLANCAGLGIRVKAA